jgi:hypothetical protein
MTDEQYAAIQKDLAMIISNQTIINNNITRLENRLNTLQDDMRVSLNNEIILGRDQDKMQADVDQILRVVSR